MTYLGTHYPNGAASHTDFGVRAAGMLGRTWQSIRRFALVDHSRQALDQLPDRILEDIGLRRGEIDGIAANLVDGIVDETRRKRGRPSA